MPTVIPVKAIVDGPYVTNVSGMGAWSNDPLVKDISINGNWTQFILQYLQDVYDHGFSANVLADVPAATCTFTASITGLSYNYFNIDSYAQDPSGVWVPAIARSISVVRYGPRYQSAVKELSPRAPGVEARPLNR